jgi:hypothetical protein
MAKLGVHKQYANRLVEPWLWHTVVVTSTEWDNFFALRYHSAAQPEIREAAECMLEVYRAALTAPVSPEGTEHLPFVTPTERLEFSLEERLLISAGRCARLSYMTHDGRRDPLEDISLARRLRVAGHMSPFEHQGWVGGGHDTLSNRSKAGNFHYAYVQWRKTMTNETRRFDYFGGTP